MRKVDNWDLRLVEFAREVEGRVFVWGETDCASLVRRGLTAILGVDPWRGYVGTWKTSRGALGVSKRTKPQDALRASGAVEMGVHRAWSGDVALAAGVDDHGMIQVALLLPTRKALTSTFELGVVIVDKLSLNPRTRFWRYGG